MFEYGSGPWILCGIRQGFGLIVGNVENAQEFEYFKQKFRAVSKGNGAMVRIALLNQYMAVETAHFRNCEYADAAEGTCGHRQDFTLRNVLFVFNINLILSLL